MGREFELKFAAKPEDLAVIREKYPHLAPILMETTYYDNDRGDMARMHWTLRRRRENDRVVCALKTPGDSRGHGEWEADCDRIEDAIVPLCELGDPKELLVRTARGLHPVCGARFTRLAGLLEAEGCTVELALDQGVVTGGGKEAPLCEMEVELKSGSTQAAAAFAYAIAGEFGLEEAFESKISRALALAREGEAHV